MGFSTFYQIQIKVMSTSVTYSKIKRGLRCITEGISLDLIKTDSSYFEYKSPMKIGEFSLNFTIITTRLSREI